jgi:starch-binding outer membrane protein, SusD/RagB family
VLGKTKPTKVAAYAFLSRVYLQMADYSNAKVNADACLSLYNTLMDFNDPTWVPGSASGSFKQLNPETIFYSLTDASPNSNVRAKIDSNLYKSYAANDLRKVHYFNKNTDNSYRFRGSYCGNLIELFCGFATDEVLLIRAECAAREGSTALAMKDINDLLRTRWKKIGNVTTYVDQVAATPSNALQIIISERKKELVYRELRWPDLRRLNKEQANSTTMSRELNGQTYLLSPADLRYTLLIPQEVIRITNLNQNPR